MENFAVCQIRNPMDTQSIPFEIAPPHALTSYDTMASPACTVIHPNLPGPALLNGAPALAAAATGASMPGNMSPLTEQSLGSPPIDINALGQPQMLTIRMLMSGKEVGSIIGKRGDNVKKYREESGARINISDGSCPERIVTVTGTVDQIYTAFTLMCQKFEDDFTSSISKTADEVSCPPVTLRLLVPATQCGSIIGKGGCKIKEIRELTGASIQVASEVLPNSSERTVTISGTAKAISKCIRQLCHILIESPPKGATIPYRPKPALPPGLMIPQGPGTQLLPPGSVPLPSEFTKALPPSPLHPAGVSLLSMPAGPGAPGTIIPAVTARLNPHISPLSLAVPWDRSVISAASHDWTFDKQVVEHMFWKDAQNFEEALLAGAACPIPNVSLAPALPPPIRNQGPAPPAPTQTQEMTIPNDLVGCIIGRGGNKINEIRQASGAQIKISNCEEGARERKITITGTPDTISAAQFLINNSIELHKHLLALNMAMANPLAAAAAVGLPPGLPPPMPPTPGPPGPPGIPIFRPLDPASNALQAMLADPAHLSAALGNAPNPAALFSGPQGPPVSTSFAGAFPPFQVSVTQAVSPPCQSPLMTKIKPQMINGSKRAPSKFTPY